jgi:hypothetical protein
VDALEETAENFPGGFEFFLRSAVFAEDVFGPADARLGCESGLAFGPFGRKFNAFDS